MKTQPYHIKVNRVEGGEAEVYDKSVLKEEVKALGADIRHIHSKIDLSKGDDFFIFSPLYFTFSGIGLLALIAAIGFEYKKRSDKKDPAGYKVKKAASLAQKKLKGAEGLISGDKNQFYGVLLSCFDSYLMDKFSMDRNQLSKEAIKHKLVDRAGGEMADKAIKEIEGWEMKQYAPVQSENPSTDYEVAKNLIIELESRIKLS